jgi:hypothetical protein
MEIYRTYGVGVGWRDTQQTPDCHGGEVIHVADEGGEDGSLKCERVFKGGNTCFQVKLQPSMQPYIRSINDGGTSLEAKAVLQKRVERVINISMAGD